MRILTRVLGEGWSREVRGQSGGRGGGENTIYCSKTVLRQASAWNRLWRDFLEVWGVPKQTSKNFASEGFRMQISTPRQLLRSLGPLPETSARTPPELPRSPSRSGSSQEAGRKIVLCRGGWLQGCFPHSECKAWLKNIAWAVKIIHEPCTEKSTGTR